MQTLMQSVGHPNYFLRGATELDLGTSKLHDRRALTASTSVSAPMRTSCCNASSSSRFIMLALRRADRLMRDEPIVSEFVIRVGTAVTRLVGARAFA